MYSKLFYIFKLNLDFKFEEIQLIGLQKPYFPFIMSLYKSFSTYRKKTINTIKNSHIVLKIISSSLAGTSSIRIFKYITDRYLTDTTTQSITQNQVIVGRKLLIFSGEILELISLMTLLSSYEALKSHNDTKLKSVLSQVVINLVSIIFLTIVFNFKGECFIRTLMDLQTFIQLLVITPILSFVFFTV